MDFQTRLIGQALARLRCPTPMESSTAEVRVIGTVVRVPGSVRKRYGIFTITRSFGCVSVPNGEPAIGESNPVEALMVKTEMSPPTLLVTSRNFPDGSIATLRERCLQ